MYSLLLALIYLAFISLGLPDSLLGSAWPNIQSTVQVPTSYGGILSFLITASTILSSLGSGRMMRRFGTGGTACLSVALTAAALLGFSVSNHFFALCLWAVPYGLGAGSVDAVLNHYVALHYKAKHMSWLHCFWGIGATGGPYIMGLCLSSGMGWQSGYRVIFGIQFVFTLILLLSLPLWKQRSADAAVHTNLPYLPLKQLLGLPAAKTVLPAFFLYSALEMTTGLWGSSYMVTVRGISTQTAASWIALFYLGMTLGRFFSGFLTTHFSDRQLIRFGGCMAILGIFLLILPLPPIALCLGFFLTGLGCAPIYPSMLHATPAIFGTEAASSMMGTQMAFSYLGSTCMPPLCGLLTAHISMVLYPFVLFFFAVLLLVLSQIQYPPIQNGHQS